MFLSLDDGGITYWGAPTVLTSAQEQRESWERRGLFQRACTLQNRTEETLKNKLQRDRKTESQSLHKGRSLFWQKKPKSWCHSFLLCPVRRCQPSHTPHMWDRQRITIQILEHISNRITFPAVITAFDGEHTSDILLSTLYFFFSLYLFRLFSLPLYFHVSAHIDTTGREGGKVVKRVWVQAGSIVIWDDEIKQSGCSHLFSCWQL